MTANEFKRKNAYRGCYSRNCLNCGHHICKITRGGFETCEVDVCTANGVGRRLFYVDGHCVCNNWRPCRKNESS